MHGWELIEHPMSCATEKIKEEWSRQKGKEAIVERVWLGVLTSGLEITYS